MKNSNTKKETPAPGAEAPQTNGQEKVVFDLDTTRKYLRRDLAGAIALLNAIHSDPDLIEQMAVFMYGRLTNHQAKQMHVDDQLKQQ